MKSVHHIILVLLFIGIVSKYTNCHAQSVMLDSVYQKLDETIKNSATYKETKLKEISVHRKQWLSAKSAEQKYQTAFQCYLDYRAFENDSALHYLFCCLDLAEKNKKTNLQAYCNTLIGHQYVVSGYFNEAQNYLEAADPNVLNTEQLNTYYYYKNHLYRELALYGHDKKLHRLYSEMARKYLDSVNITLKPVNKLYYQRRCITNFHNANYQDAMQINDEWMLNCKQGTQSYATMAYYRSEIYRVYNNKDMQKYWLAVASINELQSAMMNQVALWNLAEIMNNDGDIDHAFSYVECSWQNISQFSTHKRSWVVTPILTQISQEYRTKLGKVNSTVTWLLCATLLSIIFLLLSLIIVLRERKLTNAAQHSLKITYEELAILNKRLSNLNTRLVDSNRVKDQYITNFFHICSEYIEKMDNYRLKINRKLKVNQIKEVINLTSSEQMKEDERKMLLKHFDKVFLNLYPNFVEEFNAMLKPEARITPKRGEQMNTTLRIFALIRLGINGSSNIAEFLNYAPNSIYAYRARTKNGAIKDRDDFENQIMKIGLTV